MRPSSFVLALALLASAAPSRAQTLRRGDDYPGSQFLFHAASVTVVYPGGAGEDAEGNRISAQARARFLSETGGADTRVVADVDAKPADLRGNLLVLGWTNRVLGTKDAPRPFRRSPDGRGDLLDGIPFDTGDDVLVFSRSPYDPEGWLFFWSRIDADRDRMLVLPKVGSDWAVIRDFRVIRQGMCLPGKEWPPKRDEQAEGDHTTAIAGAWSSPTTASHGKVVVHYDGARIPQDEANGIAWARDAALAAAIEAVGPLPAEFREHVFVYADEKEKERMTGIADAGHSVPSEREVHIVRRIARTPSPHEEVHLVAGSRFGACASTALYEGLAISVEDSVGRRPLEVAAALVQDAGSLPSLDAVLDEEAFRKAPVDAASTTAGLLARWLLRTLPRETFAKVYRVRDVSPATIAEASGMTPEALRTGFAGFVGAIAASHRADVEVSHLEKTAQERLVLGDYAGVARALEKSLAIRPDDPQTLFNLGSARMRTGELDAAEGSFRRLVEAKLAPADSRFRIFSWYQIGRIRDLRGERQSALEAYRKVLELPDEYDAHRLATERIASPATREQLE